MNKLFDNKIIKFFVILLILIESIFMYLSYKSFNNKNNKINEVKINTNLDNSSQSMFAIMLGDGNGNFQEQKDRSSWPDKNTYAYSHSICTDYKGNKIPNSNLFTFNNKTFTATINTKQTIYCYLYFDKPLEIASLAIRNSGVTNGSLETVANMQSRSDTLRRFQGEQAKVNDNYLCFGSNEYETCTGSEADDKYLYRIIGIDTTNNEIEVIKKKSIGSYYYNNSDYGEWKDSYLFKQLNGIDTGSSSYPSNIFLTNAEKYPYMQKDINTETVWTKLIKPRQWISFTSSYCWETTTGKEMLEKEKASLNRTVLAKISLILPSDYCLAYNNTTPCYDSTNSNSSNWMNNNGKSYFETWTSASVFDDMYAYFVRGSYLYPWERNRSNGVVPIFYISNTAKAIGSGTVDDPYRITNV